MHEPCWFKFLRQTLRSIHSRFLNHAAGQDEVAGEGRGGGARDSGADSFILKPYLLNLMAEAYSFNT